MKFTLIIATLATIAAASPLQPRAVFKATTFNDISIAGGTAGKAKEEAAAALSGLPTDLTTVQKADLDFLNSVNQVANDAETDAFNPAIEAATGDAADALQVRQICERRQVLRRPERHLFCVEALLLINNFRQQRGKIKNKVLKLTATVMKLQAQEAQGTDVADKLAEEQTKLNNNIKQDVAAAGQASTAVSFSGNIA